MIKCCYKCQERWVRDGKTCHSTCKRYADEVAEYQRRKEAERDAQKGFIELCAYKKSHYKARDNHASSGAIPRKRRW